MWVLLTFHNVGSALLMTSLPYVAQDFFAKHYTLTDRNTIHCDQTPGAEFCKKAFMDFTAWKTGLSCVGFLIKFMLAPTLGVLSDTLGRRPVLVTCCLLQLFPLISMMLHVNLGLNLQIALVLTVTGDLPLLGLALAYAADRLQDQHARMLGFGLIVAFSSLSGLAALCFSGTLSPARGTNFGCGVLCLNVMYVTFLLPESLPAERRSTWQPAKMWPVAALRILLRNRFLVTVSICLLLTGFVDSALDTFGPPYFQNFLALGREQFTQMTLTSKASLLLWSSFGLAALNNSCGEVGTLALAVLAGIGTIASVMLVTTAPQLFAAFGFLHGLKMLSFPAMSALKSTYVLDDEQGQIQGGLTAISSMTTDLAPMLLGPVFQATGSTDARIASNLVWALCALLLSCALALVMTLPPLQHVAQRWLGPKTL